MAKRIPDVLDLAATPSTNGDSEPKELTEELVQRALELESGSLFDWSDIHEWGQLFDNPDLLIKPSERSWITDVETMLDRSGQASSVEKALSLPLRMANLTIEAPEEDHGQTDFVREVLYSAGQGDGMAPDIVQIVSQMTYAIAVKRTYHELVWKQRPDGRLGFKRIAWRPPASCELIRDRRHGSIRGYRQWIDLEIAEALREQNDPRDTDRLQMDEGNEFGYLTIPANRAVIYIHGQHRDPVNGISDLEVTHWAHTLQQKILMLWTIFLDQQAHPKTIAYGDSQTEADKAAKQIAALRGGGVVGVKRDGASPDKKIFDLLETSGKGAAVFQEMIRYLDQQMSHSVLAGFLDLTSNASEGIGSYALSADQKGLFLTSRQAASKEISVTVTQQIIRPLVRVNFGSKAALPRLVFEKMSEEQTEKAIQMLQQLGSANNVHVPPGFLDLLVERVGQFLDLDDTKVEALLKEHADMRRQAAEQMGRPEEQSQSIHGQITDQVNGAIDVVREHRKEKQ